MNGKSYCTYRYLGLALDPIHVGTGGNRLGRVDNTIVRDPVTRVPKIPGSSIAGVTRAYVAMAVDKYPVCAGLGNKEMPHERHCGGGECKVCTAFGFAKGTDEGSGFAGLAGFSDMHVLLFPVASQAGPKWVTSAMTLMQSGIFDEDIEAPKEDVVLRMDGSNDPIKLGWLYLEAMTAGDKGQNILHKMLADFCVPNTIKSNICLVSEKLFTHLVNSSLEVRTSVAIDPATGAAEDKALFSYEALPRTTVLSWTLTCKNPKHFKISGTDLSAVENVERVKDVIEMAHPYLENLGIGGMGTRGMGRLRVFSQDCNGSEKGDQKSNGGDNE